ncbi:MAG: glycosyltransferase [Gammaproteobacteria bacterium]
MYSLVIPVYKNEESISQLIFALEGMNNKLGNQLEVVFVVDGSPDQSYALLKAQLPQASFTSQLLLLSRNFGSYAAFRAGLEKARGQFFAIMAADLQEPPELIIEIFECLSKSPIDIAFAQRLGRKDPLAQKMFAKLFWFIYKKAILKDMPAGGVDIFGCNLVFRDHLLKLNELNSSTVGLAFWLGFRRKFIGYQRLERQHGKSAFSWGRRIKYSMDSSFAFSDIPIKLLYFIGIAGISISFLLGLIIIGAKISGAIPVPGYAATIITIVFFAALNLMGLGIIGSYVWRAFENTKSRPQSVVMSALEFCKSDLIIEKMSA